LCAQWETPPCGGELRIELGPALQQADALPNEPRRAKVPVVLNKLHNFEKYFSCTSRRLDQSNFFESIVNSYTVKKAVELLDVLSRNNFLM